MFRVENQKQVLIWIQVTLFSYYKRGFQNSGWTFVFVQHHEEPEQQTVSGNVPAQIMQIYKHTKQRNRTNTQGFMDRRYTTRLTFNVVCNTQVVHQREPNAGADLLEKRFRGEISSRFLGLFLVISGIKFWFLSEAASLWQFFRHLWHLRNIKTWSAQVWFRSWNVARFDRKDCQVMCHF